MFRPSVLPEHNRPHPPQAYGQGHAVPGPWMQAATMPASDSVGLAEFSAILRRRARTILTTTALTTCLGLAYIVVTKPQFTAVTAVFVDPRQKASFQIEGQGAGAGYDANLVDSQVRLIESDTVLNRVIEKEKLLDDPEFNRGGDNPARATMKNLKEAVKVKRPEKTYVVEIEVRTNDALKSARIANGIASAYLSDSLDARTENARRESVWLEKHLRDLQARLKDAENRVEAYKAENKIIGSEGKLVNELQLTELNKGLIEARRRASEAKATYDQVLEMRKQGRMSDTTSEALKSTVIDRLRGQLAEILRLDANSRSTLGPRHPASQEIREQLAETRRQISEELGRIAQSAESTYRVARMNEISLEKQLDGLKNLSTSTNQTLVRLRELEREAEAQKAVFQKFLGDKEQIARLTVDTTAGRIIMPAVAPQNKSHPKTILVLGLALVGGFLLGVAIALTRETLARGQSQSEMLAPDARYSAPPPGYGAPQSSTQWAAPTSFSASMPAPSAWPQAQAQIVTASLPPLPARGTLRWINKNGSATSSSDAYDLVNRHPASDYSRAMYALASDLMPLLSRKASPSLLISGLNETAESSLLTTNLAATFAARGLNVLIVDAHPHAHGLSAAFAKQRSRICLQLAGSLVNAIELPFQSSSQAQGGVFLLPIGEMGTLSGLGAISPDLVLIDGPNTSSNAMADPALRARVDGVIIALPASVAPNRPDVQAEAMREFGPQLMGLVARAA